MDRITGIGACNADIIGQSRNAPVMRDSNPGFMRITPGGVTRNILENAARLGLGCTLLSAVGRDAMGDAVLEATRRAGVDVSGVLRLAHTPTSTYCAILEPCGDMLLALSDMRILEHISDAYLEGFASLMSSSEAVVIDPSLPERAIARTIELCGKTPVFADPVSTTYAKKLTAHTGRLFMLKPNRIELEVLAGRSVNDADSLRAAAQSLVERGCKRVYVTLGENGCAYADDAGRYIRMKLAPVRNMANATGAGDAFTAAALFAHVSGFDAQKSVALALAAGLAAVGCEQTVHPDMSPALLERILAENPPVLCG